MGVYLNPGNGMFEESLRSEIYVDKTGLIACTNRVLGNRQKYVCVSRPRRVGKYDTRAQTVYLDFLRALLRDKAYVRLAYMTDILPIKKYGAHSSVNMLASYVGFTEEEVNTLCQRYDMDFTEAKSIGV